MASFSAPVITLPKNKRGTDYLLGDLCGNAPLLTATLRAMHFDPDRDRVISTGNLINKGPDSFGVLKLLKQPWFHAVLGSSEAQALAWLRKDYHCGEDPRSFILQGGNWIHAYPSQEDRAFIQETLEQLPLALKVSHTEGAFRVVHSRWSAALENETCTTLQAREAIWGVQLAIDGMKSLGRLAMPPESHVVVPTPGWEDPDKPGRLTYCGHAGHPAFRLLHRGHLHLCSGMHWRYTPGPQPLMTNLMLAAHEFWLSQAAQPSLEFF